MQIIIADIFRPIMSSRLRKPSLVNTYVPGSELLLDIVLTISII
jgi:hypothetical protein